MMPIFASFIIIYHKKKLSREERKRIRKRWKQHKRREKYHLVKVVQIRQEVYSFYVKNEIGGNTIKYDLLKYLTLVLFFFNFDFNSRLVKDFNYYKSINN